MRSSKPSPSDFMVWYDSLSEEEQCEVETQLCCIADKLGVAITEVPPVAYQLLDFRAHITPQVSLN